MPMPAHQVVKGVATFSGVVITRQPRALVTFIEHGPIRTVKSMGRHWNFNVLKESRSTSKSDTLRIFSLIVIGCCSKACLRSSHRRCFVRKPVLRCFAKFTGKHLGQTLLQALVQVFSCKFCEIYKNTFFTDHIWTTASEALTNHACPKGQKR